MIEAVLLSPVLKLSPWSSLYSNPLIHERFSLKPPLMIQTKDNSYKLSTIFSVHMHTYDDADLEDRVQ